MHTTHDGQVFQHAGLSIGGSALRVNRRLPPAAEQSPLRLESSGRCRSHLNCQQTATANKQAASFKGVFTDIAIRAKAGTSGPTGRRSCRFPNPWVGRPTEAHAECERGAAVIFGNPRNIGPQQGSRHQQPARGIGVCTSRSSTRLIASGRSGATMCSPASRRQWWRNMRARRARCRENLRRPRHP